VAIIGCIGMLLWQAWDTDRDMYISAEQLEAFERLHPSLGTQR
jgi:hypothetical protein